MHENIVTDPELEKLLGWVGEISSRQNHVWVYGGFSITWMEVQSVL